MQAHVQSERMQRRGEHGRGASRAERRARRARRDGVARCMPSAGSYTGLFQHPAAVSARRSDAETGAEILEQRRRQPLGEDIGELL